MVLAGVSFAAGDLESELDADRPAAVGAARTSLPTTAAQPPAWGAALQRSQRRAAARRAAAEHQLSVRRWLRDRARR
jgi:hypothetical protein